MGDRLRPARAEERSNSFNHLTADIDGTTPHCVHTWSPYQDAVPLLMVHDWPLSHVRMFGIIPLPTQPETSRSSLQPSPASTSAARTRPCPRH
ncbi:epoxide hydrolase N-terminal domain-containing protein [Streptomyces mexicanus]|uniref:epoxide hydrolase N-terminal domain-containing protein n=1 Tax=Streptomyces mexicanus TaxID=178566 RepID=UPI003668B17D